ncbi:hypothetical protein BT69DRAFT_1288069 [Atractiella rhizophila]|nr:hypothetical protein BT69DRAFT_1288069 [Atractiella rhizophila]
MHEELKRVRLGTAAKKKKESREEEEEELIWEVKEVGAGGFRGGRVNKDGTLEKTRKKKPSRRGTGEESSALLDTARRKDKADDEFAPKGAVSRGLYDLEFAPPLFDTDSSFGRYIRNHASPHPVTKAQTQSKLPPTHQPTKLKMPTPLSPSRFPNPQTLEQDATSTLELDNSKIVKSPLSSYNRGPMIEGLDLEGLSSKKEKKKERMRRERRERRSSDPGSRMDVDSANIDMREWGRERGGFGVLQGASSSSWHPRSSLPSSSKHSTTPRSVPFEHHTSSSGHGHGDGNRHWTSHADFVTSPVQVSSSAFSRTAARAPSIPPPLPTSSSHVGTRPPLPPPEPINYRPTSMPPAPIPSRSSGHSGRLRGEEVVIIPSKRELRRASQAVNQNDFQEPRPLPPPQHSQSRNSREYRPPPLSPGSEYYSVNRTIDTRFPPPAPIEYDRRSSREYRTPPQPTSYSHPSWDTRDFHPSAQTQDFGHPPASYPDYRSPPPSAQPASSSLPKRQSRVKRRTMDDYAPLPLRQGYEYDAPHKPYGNPGSLPLQSSVGAAASGSYDKKGTGFRFEQY